MARHQSVQPRPTVPPVQCDARGGLLRIVVVFSFREHVLQVSRLQTCVVTCAVQVLDSMCQEPVIVAADSTQYLHDIEHVLGLMVWRADAANYDANDACHILPKVLQRCPLRIEYNREVGLKQSLTAK